MFRRINETNYIYPKKITGGIGFTTLMRSLSRTNRGYLKHTDKVRAQKEDLQYRPAKRWFVFKKASVKIPEKQA